MGTSEKRASPKSSLDHLRPYFEKLDECLKVGGRYDYLYSDAILVSTDSPLDDYWRTRLFLLVMLTELSGQLSKVEITQLA